MRLSLQQEDIFYEQQLFPDTPIYNIGAKIEIKGALDIEAMKLAYSSLISQHDTFHSYVTESSSGPEMQVLETYSAVLQVLDLSTHEQPLKAAEAYMREVFTTPFDLSKELPPHSFAMIKVADNYHYLFFVCHHIITDGWGTSLMFQRLTELYNDIVQSGAIQHEYNYPYTHFIDKDLQYRESESYREDAAYWKEKFSTLPASLIPRKHVKGRTGGFTSARKVLSIERPAYNKLNELAKANDASTFHVLLACMYIYLGRIYDNHDFAIGLPVLNRGSKAFKHTAGLFMGVSPLRLAIDPEDSFAALVKQVKNELRKDYRHQGFPLGRIIQQLNLYEQKDRLFNVTFSYEKHDYAHTFYNTRTRVLPMTHEAERVALAVYVREFDEQDDVKVDIDYNTDYFNETDADMLVQHLGKLIKEVIANPLQAAHAIEFMDSSELSRLLRSFNDTALIYPKDKSIVDLLRDAAGIFPSRIAVMDRERSYTYREVEQYAGRIAGYLRGQGLAAPAEPVGVMMDRSGKMLITLIGVLTSGAAYLPLDPSFPRERLRYIIGQSGCKVLIADGQYMEAFADDPQLTLIDAASLHDLPHEYTASTLTDGPGPGDLAYIIYTSGSTGQPKGVEICHRSVVNFLSSMRVAPGITSADKLLAVTTYSFDISVLEFFLPLIAGASVYIADKSTTADPDALIRLIEAQTPTVMQATPSLWHMLFMSGWQGDASLRALCGGEPLDHATGQQLMAQCKALWNMYGPTETTIWSAIKQIRSPEDMDNIGKPIGNTCIYILDQWGHPVPVGAVGEIYIGGAGLAKGYRFRKDLTAERFIPNPFIQGENIYRTGDVGKWLPNGEISFLGRKDNQVKIRGYRVELGEIERQLLLAPGVQQAVVVARKNDDLRTFLAAFLVSSEALDEKDMQELLRTTLPEYMIPSAFIAIAEIPTTPNGKVDRNALASRDIAAVLSAAVYEAPDNELEHELQTLWRDILSLDKIGVSDNFFSLGGHSLNATRLINDIYRYYGVKLKLRTVFLNPTIRQLASCITEEKKVVFQPIAPAPPAPYYPLSPNQEGIWMAAQSGRGVLAYNMTGVYSIEGPLSVKVLEAALSALIRRHESLRTAFIERNGLPVQKVLAPDELSFKIRVHDCGKCPDGAADTLIDELVQYRFALDKPPLIKADVIELSDDKRILVFVLHHIVADGWSLNILLAELTNLYQEYSEGGKQELPQLPVQYKDYTAWLLARLSSGELESHKRYWLKQFENADTRPVLKADKGVPAHPGFNGRMICFEIESSVVSQLTELASKANATLFMALLAALNALLYRESGHRDICIGTPVAGREHPDLEGQIGLYINTLALRTGFKAGSNYLQLLQTVRTVSLNAFAHQLYPYIDLERELGKRGLFEVMMVLQSRDTALEDIRGFGNTVVQRRPVAHSVSRFPLAFNFYQREGALSCEVEYDSDLYLSETIQILVARLQQLINAVIVQPEEKLEALDLLMEYERSMSSSAVSIDLDL